jgi:N-acetylmuramoyl-L-alanine amidase
MDKIRLVLDLGHGGDDPGATNPEFKLKESDVNLNIGLILKAIFDTHPEYLVWMTRTKDVPLSLSARTDLSNSNQAKIVSIHCNAVSSPQAHGTEVWCFSKEDRSGNLSEGYRLASSLVKEISALGLKNRGVKPIYDRKARQYIARPLWILRKSIHTAVLIECGFISNPEEAAKLDIDLDGFNERLAVAIFKGIDKVLNPKGGELS